jgi:hypothetical protein
MAVVAQRLHFSLTPSRVYSRSGPNFDKVSAIMKDWIAGCAHASEKIALSLENRDPHFKPTSGYAHCSLLPIINFCFFLNPRLV